MQIPLGQTSDTRFLGHEVQDQGPTREDARIADLRNLCSFFLYVGKEGRKLPIGSWLTTTEQLWYKLDGLWPADRHTRFFGTEISI